MIRKPINRRRLFDLLALGSATGAVTFLGESMQVQAAGGASLWWSWNQYTLGEAASNIGEVYQGIAQGLPNLGYIGVQVAEDVHGFKGNFILAVVYLYIGNRNFWQVVACGGDGDQAEAQADINEVKKMINALKFL